MLENLDKPETVTRFDNMEYMQVFRVCYFMCTQRSPHNFSEQLYERHGQYLRDYLRGRVLPGLRSQRDAQLLGELSKHWEAHQLQEKWLTKFFRYLVRGSAGDSGRRGGYCRR